MTITLLAGRGNMGNSYVVNGTILVDAGVTPMAVEPFRETIQYIILTHCHYDHIAYLPALMKMTGAVVCIHEADARGLRDDGPSLSMHFGAHAPGIIPDRLLTDGEVIGELEVIHTPGHTPGSICLYDPETGDLISGDTVFADGAFGRFDFPDGSRTALTDSLARLSERRVTALYPGHGLPAPANGDRHIRAASMLIRSGYV